MEQIKHPNILRLIAYEFKQNKDDVSEAYSVTPLAEKGTLQTILDQKLKTKEYFTEREVISLFRGICNGVDALHSSVPPISHNDLKVFHLDFFPSRF